MMAWFGLKVGAFRMLLLLFVAPAPVIKICWFLFLRRCLRELDEDEALPP